MQRIAKVLAQYGVASRRGAEKIIHEGRVHVNGQILETPAYLVGEHDTILIDGNPLGQKLSTRLWVFHKPTGVVTTHHDPQGRPTLFSLLPKTLPRLISVGRLDLMSEGLILLTTSGSLARTLEHPSSGVPRTYKVRLYGRLAPRHLETLSQGLTIDGVHYGGIKAKIIGEGGANTWVEMVLREGKNREIRKIMEFFGYKINRLMRTAYGPYKLDGLGVKGLKEVDPLLVHLRQQRKQVK